MLHKGTSTNERKGMSSGKLLNALKVFFTLPMRLILSIGIATKVLWMMFVTEYKEGAIERMVKRTMPALYWGSLLIWLILGLIISGKFFLIVNLFWQ